MSAFSEASAADACRPKQPGEPSQPVIVADEQEEEEEEQIGADPENVQHVGWGGHCLAMRCVRGRIAMRSQE
jgi:hypothetical protein